MPCRMHTCPRLPIGTILSPASLSNYCLISLFPFGKGSLENRHLLCSPWLGLYPLGFPETSHVKVSRPPPPQCCLHVAKRNDYIYALIFLDIPAALNPLDHFLFLETSNLSLSFLVLLTQSPAALMWTLATDMISLLGYQVSFNLVNTELLGIFFLTSVHGKVVPLSAPLCNLKSRIYL